MNANNNKIALAVFSLIMNFQKRFTPLKCRKIKKIFY